ncbi:uncharacterized protein B0H18DRAFT_1013023 [Fomitopsis serialis]|uniref:uncharacterized protein n=1 Tax=Fomitopsis serialis TaxID=139415 RepID=UPI00200850E6|nr:uncharacterized protein B0H18DRAFT_1013023 [Neoantrodia serialis]KAH9924014.1 hypothetical protein B0H18DRAFT_1013023 [Neoantrodia serialis]
MWEAWTVALRARCLDLVAVAGSAFIAACGWGSRPLYSCSRSCCSVRALCSLCSRPRLSFIPIAPRRLTVHSSFTPCAIRDLDLDIPKQPPQPSHRDVHQARLSPRTHLQQQAQPKPHQT